MIAAEQVEKTTHDFASGRCCCCCSTTNHMLTLTWFHLYLNTYINIALHALHIMCICAIVQFYIAHHTASIAHCRCTAHIEQHTLSSFAKSTVHSAHYTLKSTHYIETEGCTIHTAPALETVSYKLAVFTREES